MQIFFPILWDAAISNKSSQVELHRACAWLAGLLYTPKCPWAGLSLGLKGQRVLADLYGQKSKALICHLFYQSSRWYSDFPLSVYLISLLVPWSREKKGVIISWLPKTSAAGLSHEWEIDKGFSCFFFPCTANLTFFFFLQAACTIFSNQGLNLCPLHWEHSLNHWTTREVLILLLIIHICFIQLMVNQTGVQKWKRRNISPLA